MHDDSVRRGTLSRESSSDIGLQAAEFSLKHRLARMLLKAAGSPPIRIKIGDAPPASFQDDVVDTLSIRDLGTFFKLLLNPELNFGDAYMDGSLVIEGDLVRLLETFARARPQANPSYAALRWLARIAGRGRSNTLTGSRRNIHHHYDLGNDFYKLWLGREMIYTCAYFPRKDATLEEAQVAKLDHVCKKLRLRPGDRVIEAGCGWGAFALHAAVHYGVTVKAFSISHEQIVFAGARSRALGLQDSVKFIEDDYRNVAGTCDAFVSIGMLEHVGRSHYHELGQVIDRCLEAAGRGLIHSIGQNSPMPLNAWIDKRIFPGAYPPTLSEMAAMLEPWRFSVLDVENLRPHYALTLEHWLKRFEDGRDRVCELYDESFVRAWRFYLAGSIAAFRTGDLQLFQVLFNRSGGDDFAWTRDYLYSDADSSRSG